MIDGPFPYIKHNYAGTEWLTKQIELMTNHIIFGFIDPIGTLRCPNNFCTFEKCREQHGSRIVLQY